MAPVAPLPSRATMAAVEAAVALPGSLAKFPTHVLLVEHGQVHRRARGKTRKLRMHLSASGLVAAWVKSHKRDLKWDNILDIDTCIEKYFH